MTFKTCSTCGTAIHFSISECPKCTEMEKKITPEVAEWIRMMIEEAVKAAVKEHRRGYHESV